MGTLVSGNVCSVGFLTQYGYLSYKFAFIKIGAIVVLFTCVPIMKSASKFESVANEIIY
jgi:hypothetical protein